MLNDDDDDDDGVCRLMQGKCMCVWLVVYKWVIISPFLDHGVSKRCYRLMDSCFPISCLDFSNHSQNTLFITQLRIHVFFLRHNSVSSSLCPTTTVYLINFSSSSILTLVMLLSVIRVLIDKPKSLLMALTEIYSR